jgi:Rad3-related DNA helicase
MFLDDHPRDTVPNPVSFSMNYTIMVPPSVASGKEARGLLEKALDLGLKPAQAASANLRKLSLYLPAALSARVNAHPNQIGKNDLIGGLITAAIAQGNGHGAKVAHADHPGDLRKWNLHRIQEEMVAVLCKGIRGQKITLLEGSTGIGKSRVIARAALELPAKTKIGVFAPTLAVLYQLFNEFLATTRALKADSPTLALYVGRRNFVDQQRLEESIATLREAGAIEPAERARIWMKQGGPAITKTSRALQKHLPVAWLVDDLLEVVPEVSPSTVACDELSKPCPGLAVYQEAKEGLEEARVIFSTHTMFCLSALQIRTGRPALFMRFDAVFIDEAHQLEEALANCTGSELSLRHLRSSIREGYGRKKVSPSQWHQIEALIGKCQDELVAMPDDYVVPAGVVGDRHYQEFRHHAEALAKQLKELEVSEDSLWLERIKRWRYCLEQIVSYRFDTRVTFSPRLRLPNVTVGPSFLRDYFECLWQTTQSACLLSATLYVAQKPGQYSSRFMRMKLCIPSERAVDVRPFIAPWIYNSPTLYKPGPDVAEVFAYPGEPADSACELKSWFNLISRSIGVIAKEAAGGTLVLCNSYADTQAIGDLLKPSLKSRLLAQTRDDSAKALASFFKDRARDGKRPVWLATGAAWIGLDLRDEAAEEAADDWILTDLVIPRSPMGRNRTAAHIARISRLGFEQELLDAAFTLRQGLGRLIRREGLAKRNIWFLDGRIHTKRGLFHKVNILLRNYPKHQECHPALTA